MADSVDTPIVTTGWTAIQQGTSGLVTNSTDDDILYREAAADPTAAVITGHYLRAKAGFTYNLGAGQKVFARAIRTKGANVVVVTEA